MDTREIRKNNLKVAVKIFGSVTALADAAGCSAKYLENILNDFKSKNDKTPRKLGDSVAKRITNAMGKPGHWIDTLNEELWKSELGINELVVSASAIDTILIRQFDTGGAMGTGIELHDQPGIIQSWSVTNEWVEKNVRTYTSKKNLCIVTGFGDSMRPMFNPGDPLLVDRGIKNVVGDGVYFFRIENEGFVKRLQRIPTEEGIILRAISENKSIYEPFNITKKIDFEVLGRVLMVWRSEEF